jgi:hypothetical protein
MSGIVAGGNSVSNRVLRPCVIQGTAAPVQVGRIPPMTAPKHTAGSGADREGQQRVDLIHSRAEERAGDYGRVETDHRRAVDVLALCLPARQLIVTEIDRGHTSAATPESRILSSARTASPRSVVYAVAPGRCRTAAAGCMAARRRGRGRPKARRASWPQWSRDAASGLSGDAPRVGGSRRAGRAARHGLQRPCASAPKRKREGSGPGGTRLTAP